jgi:hypothetical protein
MISIFFLVWLVVLPQFLNYEALGMFSSLCGKYANSARLSDPKVLPLGKSSDSAGFPGKVTSCPESSGATGSPGNKIILEIHRSLLLIRFGELITDILNRQYMPTSTDPRLRSKKLRVGF